MPVSVRPEVGTYSADKVHSSFSFTVKHMGSAKYTAVFEDVDVTVESGDSGVRLQGSARADSISIRFPKEFREHVLYGEDFLDARNHPEITFTSSDVDLREDGTAVVNGELTIKGITKPFAATGSYRQPVEDPWGAMRTAVEFSTTVDRREWDITWQAPLPKGGNVLGWEVELGAHVELVRQA